MSPRLPPICQREPPAQHVTAIRMSDSCSRCQCPLGSARACRAGLPRPSRVRTKKKKKKEKGPLWMGTVSAAQVSRQASAPTSALRWMPLCNAGTGSPWGESWGRGGVAGSVGAGVKLEVPETGRCSPHLCPSVHRAVHLPGQEGLLGKGMTRADEGTENLQAAW